MAREKEEMLQPSGAAPGGDTGKKTVTMPIGVPGHTLHDEPREVPVTEPPV